MSKVFDLVIIGSGPAGLTAAIYASRAKLDTIVIEQNYTSGGQVLNTYEVDNYPGFPGISGIELGKKLREHADRFGMEFIEESVKKIDTLGEVKTVYAGKQEIKAKTIIIATGANHRLLGIQGEEELSGMGVSYCATCDGAFFKDKNVYVVGGGDTAIEEAIFLARICKQVNLVHRRDSLRGNKSLQEKMFSHENVNVVWNSVLEKIIGNEKVESIEIKNIVTGETTIVQADGVFVAIGVEPNIIETSEPLKLTSDGYVSANESCATNLSGVFVAGDLRKKPLRQIVTAVSDGANAVISVEKFL